MKIIDDVQTILGKTKNFDSPTTVSPPRKVLIVEDDAPLADALKDAFHDAGFIIFYAENGQKGLDSVKENKPDIVVLDLMMPVMDGKIMLRRLREIPEFKTLPVIVLTNAGQVDNIRETVDYDNAIEFLIKSNVSLDEIVDKVKRTH
jgi:DNA-binding response OmpR family regulator